MRKTSLLKYAAIQQRFECLYNEERRRIDDVEQVLCREFFLSPARLAVILKMRLPQNSG